MENVQLIEETLKEFLMKTTERKIPWTLINPNAVRWTKSAPPKVSIVTIQKQLTPTVPSGVKENYVFTVQTQNSATTLQINSANEQLLRDVMSKLFKEALLTANDKSVEILRNLLTGI